MLGVEHLTQVNAVTSVPMAMGDSLNANLVSVSWKELNRHPVRARDATVHRMVNALAR